MESFDIPGFEENEQNQLKEEYQKQNPASDLEKKTIRELRRRGLIKRSFFYHYKFMKPAFAFAVISLIFILGFFVGEKSTLARISQPNQDQYLFLLYNPDNYQATSSHVKEYGDWFRSIKGNVEGEELSDKLWMIALNNNKPVIETLHGTYSPSGYFIIHATSENEAIQIASTCPHLKYNGKIEVRPIQSHN